MDSRLLRVLLTVACVLVVAVMVAVGCLIVLVMVPCLLDVALVFWALAFG